MPADYTLWFSPGACSRVSLIALEACGADYELRHVPLAQGANKEAAYLALNPKGKVPLLETSLGLLSENVAIVSWLDSRHPQAGLLPPHNPWQRVQALSLMSWCASTLHPMIYRVRMTARIHDDAATHGQIKALALAELAAQMQVAEQRLEAGPWLMGEAWSMADPYLFWVWSRGTESGLDKTRYPRVAAHAERLAARPEVQRALAREAAAAA